MKPPRFGVRLAAAGAILLAAFSALATWLIDTGRWPELPPGALRDVDLWAGLAFLALVLFFLLRRSRRPT
ncbi:MAG: hypothetical protein ACRD1B_06460 [Thermoanaerobaculia bacterium]